MSEKEERKYNIIFLILGILGCIATWLALPQIQNILNGSGAATLTLATPTPSHRSTPDSSLGFTPQATIGNTYPPAQSPIVVTAPPVVVTSSATPTTINRQNCAPIEGVLAAAWAQVRNRIGCSKGVPIYGQVVVEDFERGKMLWRQPVDLGTQTIGYALVLSYAGTWKRYGHSLYTGSGGTSCAEAMNGIPTGGLGKMWCDIPEIRQLLGNAVTGEKNYQDGNVMMDFDSGFMVYTQDGSIYVFYQDHEWEQL